MKPAYYITTPIYYVNDKPHIGHAYTTLACDVLARFKRLDGFDVRFLTGTDEHGQKVQKSAEVAGIDPQTFTDQVSQNFRDMTGLLNFSNDDFIRTTESRHREACQALWRKLVEKGDIYLGSYAGWYAVRDEAYYQEDELTAEGWNWENICPLSKTKRVDALNRFESEWTLANKEAWLSIGSQVAEKPWDAVVADESHFLKNPRAKVTKYFLKSFGMVPHRWVLIRVMVAMKGTSCMSGLMR